MPYINLTQRIDLNPIVVAGMHHPSITAGELNYTLTMLCINYMEHNGKNYQHINDVVGALEGAKMEFYRRYAAPYEDTKIIQNGDVYNV